MFKLLLFVYLISNSNLVLIFLNTGHPLFQGVSHDLSYSPIILLPALVLWAILSWPISNQRLCDPP